MGLALGTVSPTALAVGTAVCTGLFLGSNQVWAPTSGPTLSASDDFTGANGAAWDATKWQLLRSDGYSVQQSGKGRMQGNSTSTGTDYAGVRQAAKGLSLKNVEAYVEFTPRAVGNGAEAYIDLSVRQDLTKTGPFPDGYFISADTGGTGTSAVWTLGKIDTVNGQDVATQQDTQVVWTVEPWAARLRAVDNVITGKVWKVSAGESTAVTKTLTDSTYNRSGSVALGYSTGQSNDPGIDWDTFRVYDLGGNSGGGTTPAPATQTYTFPMTGTNGAAMPTGLSIAKGVPPAYTPVYPTRAPTIQSNRLLLTSGSTAAWSGGASFFLGDPNKPEGDATTYPPITSDGTWTWDMEFLNLSEQYPTIGFGTRGADLWPNDGGGGSNMPRNGGYAFQLGVAGGRMDLLQNYNSATIASGIPVTFAVKMKAKLVLLDKQISFKLWPSANAEPTAFNYDAPTRFDQSDGNLVFGISNGPAAEQKTFAISNIVHTQPVQYLDTQNLTSPPATEPTGFTRITTATFGTAAPAGKGTGQFQQVYSNVFQPYNDGGTVYDPANPNTTGGANGTSKMISAHDGVMDVYSDGVYASGGSFGSPTNTYNRQGGRFSIRMKAIGMFGNGPAFMIWPSDTANGTWYFGELDFPESVSGRGGPSGFQDAPFIHHHKMVQGQESQAQDVNLGVSWRDWHEYTLEWYLPGTTKGGSTGLVIYYVDGEERYRTTQDVPTTVHRWCFQIGDWGTAGHIYINWYTMAAPA